VPDDVTVECSAVPDPPTVTATDNCDHEIVVDYKQERTDGDCPQDYVLTRTWTATDDCGNTASASQIITVQDTTPPDITCPTTDTIKCDDPTDPSFTGWPTVTDNCGEVVVTHADQVLPSECPQEKIIVRTWTATDECGNSDSCEQRISVVDDEAPIITNCSADKDVCADQDLKAVIPNVIVEIIVKDNCDPGPLTITQDPPAGTVVGVGEHLITVTVSDGCGNESTCVVKFRVHTGNIIVHKFHDVNGDGLHDGDGPLANWTFTLKNAQGQPIATWHTDANGMITWGGLGCGLYTIEEMPMLGGSWTNSTPMVQTVEVKMDQTAEAWFGNYLLGKISGHKFNDVNGNHAYDAGELRMAGWVIHLLDAQGNVLETKTTTAPDGYYEFKDLLPGVYGLSEEPQTGWTNSKTPAQVNLDPEEESVDNDFGNFQRFIVRGHKWLDKDGDGTWDSGEPGIPGWTITLSGPSEAEIWAGSTATAAAQNSTKTDATGAYTFTLSLPGQYTISEEHRDGYEPTTPDSVQFTAEGGREIVIDFGNRTHLGGGGSLGNKFWDLNHNAVWDEGEPALPGWKIIIRNASGAQVYETTTMDAPNTPNHGAWFVTEWLAPGDYTVEEAPRGGWVQTYPETEHGVYRIRITGDGKYQLLSAKPGWYNNRLNFGNARVMGYKFEDVDENRQRDSGEQLLGGWTITMRNAANQIAYTTQTVGAGGMQGMWYLESLLPEGDYFVSEETQQGWTQTYPASNAGGYTIHMGKYGEYELKSARPSWFEGLNFGNVRRTGGRCPDCPQWLVFQSDRVDGNYNIFRSKFDGTEVKQLTNAPQADISPVWNFPGTEIAFATLRDGNWEIYRMGPDGGNQINVTKYPTATDIAPSWSCNWIAFQSNRDGNWEIYKTDPDGRQQIRLTDNPASDEAPTWSPDGEKIAFQSNRDGNWEIYIMDGDGGNVVRLTDNAAADRNPDWSTDGQWIVFESNREGNQYDIFKMNVATREVVRLTDNPADDTNPAWMPYCEWIFFQSNRDQNNEVYRMKYDGTLQLNLTRVPNDDVLDFVPGGITAAPKAE
jgi:hypothetical protein